MECKGYPKGGGSISGVARRTHDKTYSTNDGEPFSQGDLKSGHVFDSCACAQLYKSLRLKVQSEL